MWVRHAAFCLTFPAVMSLASIASKPLSAAIFLIALIAISFYIFVIDLAVRPLIDFDVYILAGHRLLAGENIYSPAYTVVDRAGRSVELLYLYPPLLAQILSKLTSIAPVSARFTWCITNYIALWVAILSISRVLAASWWAALPQLQRVALVAFFTLCFEPLYIGVADGQVTAVILALLALCAVGALSGREWLVGSALALAMHIKCTPALLLVAPIVFGRWRALAWFGGVAVSLALVSLLDTAGLQLFEDFFASALRSADEQALGGFAHNLKLSRSLLGPLGLADVAAARWALKGLVIAAALLGALRLRPQALRSKVVLTSSESFAYLRAVGFLIPLMILLAPIVWFHHLAWGLIPLAVGSMCSAKNIDERMKLLTLSLGLYFICSQSYLLLIWTIKLAPGLSELAALLPALALVALSAMIYRQRGI